MDENERIRRLARKLFPVPIVPVEDVQLVEMPGFRHDGKRWVDATRPDAPGVVAEDKPEPTQWSDLVTYRKGRSPSEPQGRKSRRRGGF